MKLSGQKALVTGGAMGIGLATARLLMREGCAVAILDLNEEALERAARELNAPEGALFTYQCDVTQEDQVSAAIDKAERNMGRIDILINNAGIVFPGYFHEVENAKHVKTIDVNVNALIYTTKAALKGMYERNQGVVVNISSAAGTLGVAGQVTYSASKWAVWGMTESLRHEARNLKKNVHFASVHPSYLAKGLFEGARMRGLGGLIVPQVKDHSVIAEAIVNKAIKKRKTIVFRPPSVRSAVLLRGILPDRLFFILARFLNVHNSMELWRGKSGG